MISLFRQLCFRLRICRKLLFPAVSILLILYFFTSAIKPVQEKLHVQTDADIEVEQQETEDESPTAWKNKTDFLRRILRNSKIDGSFEIIVADQDILARVKGKRTRRASNQIAKVLKRMSNHHNLITLMTRIHHITRENVHLLDKIIESILPLKCYRANYTDPEGNVVFDLHHFCRTSETYVVHVVVTWKKNDYIRFEKVRRIPEQLEAVLSKERLLLGQFDGALDWNGESYSYGDMNIPNDPLSFLLNIEYSRFLECNRSRVENFFRKYPDSAKRNYEMEDRGKSVIKKMQRMAKNHRVPIFISSGTVLGWYRECGFIAHTTDVDFGIFHRDLTKRLENELRKSDLFWFTLGQPDDGFELKFRQTDLFVFYHDNNSYWTSVVGFSGHAVYRLTYPKFTLCTAELLGELVKLPCEIDSYIETEYGKNWIEPIVDFNYLVHPHNIKFHRHVPASEWAKYFEPPHSPNDK
ncbi:Uncharacterised protein g10747 [Pycnogonum litorale]